MRGLDTSRTGSALGSLIAGNIVDGVFELVAKSNIANTGITCEQSSSSCAEKNAAPEGAAVFHFAENLVRSAARASAVSQCHGHHGQSQQQQREAIQGRHRNLLTEHDKACAIRAAR